MRRLFAGLLTLVMAVTVCGCFGSGSVSSKQLTTYFDDAPEAVSARFFVYPEGSDKYYIEELPEDRLDDLVEALDATPLRKHAGHTDYFYRGFYGIELELEDGTYLIYDCTCLSHTRNPFDAEDKNDDTIERTYLEDADKNFWDRMEEFFPSLEEYGAEVGYGW